MQTRDSNRGASTLHSKGAANCVLVEQWRINSILVEAGTALLRRAGMPRPYCRLGHVYRIRLTLAINAGGAKFFVRGVFKLAKVKRLNTEDTEFARSTRRGLRARMGALGVW